MRTAVTCKSMGTRKATFQAMKALLCVNQRQITFKNWRLRQITLLALRQMIIKLKGCSVIPLRGLEGRGNLMLILRMLLLLWGLERRHLSQWVLSFINAPIIMWKKACKSMSSIRITNTRSRDNKESTGKNSNHSLKATITPTRKTLNNPKSFIPHNNSNNCSNSWWHHSCSNRSTCTHLPKRHRNKQDHLRSSRHPLVR